MWTSSFWNWKGNYTNQQGTCTLLWITFQTTPMYDDVCLVGRHTAANMEGVGQPLISVDYDSVWNDKPTMNPIIIWHNCQLGILH